MFRFWLPSIFLFMGLLTFLFQSVFFYKSFIIFTYPIMLISNILPFSIEGRGYGNANGNYGNMDSNYFIISEYLTSPIQVPSYEFIFTIIVLLSAFLWFFIGLIIDKKIGPILKKVYEYPTKY